MKPPMIEREMVSAFLHTLKKPFLLSIWALLRRRKGRRKSKVWSGELLDTKAVRALLEQESGAYTSNRLPQKGVQKGEVKMVSAFKVNHTQKQATYAQPAVTQPFSSYHHRYNRFGSPSKHSGTNSRRTACRSKECESSILSQLMPQLRALRSIPPRTRPNPLPRWYNTTRGVSFIPAELVMTRTTATI